MISILKLVTGTMICFTMFISAITIIAAPPQPQGKLNQSIEGIWLGTLNVSGMDVRIVFKISKKEDGTLTATMDNYYQRMKDIPVNEVTYENGILALR